MDKEKILALLQENGKPPVMLNGLPLNSQQKNWLDGFLSGLQMQVADQHQTSEPIGKPLTIIYGTQTGNSEAVANEAATIAKNHGLAPTVLDMGDVNLTELVKVERLLVVTSTYGEGEMPDNAHVIWEEMTSADAPRFDNTYYSVLALGDTSYDDFCEAGILWDKRLEELGGSRIADRVDCDVDYEPLSQEWIGTVMPIMTERGSQEAVQMTVNGKETQKPKYTRKNPLEAELITKKLLSSEDSSKEIVHYEFSLGSSGETYLAGDALNVVPENSPQLIQEILDLFDTKTDEETRRQLRYDLEIRTPSKELIQLVGENTEDEELKRMVENDDKEAIDAYMWGLDCHALIKSYGHGKISFYDFLKTCKPLTPRAYSISSSIKAHENEVHLTISSVRYSREDRAQNGVASTYLADMVKVGENVKCYFSPNKQFKIPENGDLPIIMVGPGTGIAPFRAFLEEREQTSAKGENWLFFGDRNKAHDFIYQDEIEEMVKNGLLSRLDLAFSRDQNEKVYVQDKMLAKGDTLFQWLERGAYFYICGDAFRMARDVDQALHTIVSVHGKMSDSDAASYVNNLKKQKRYVRDVY
ncbi:MAG: flavodoxin domain-containing protein [Bacteroidota bacterium]